MLALQYMINGPSLYNHCYNRFDHRYTQDSASAVTSTNKFNGDVHFKKSISLVAEGEGGSKIERWVQTNLIDDGVHFYTVTDDQRSLNKSFWQKTKISSVCFSASFIAIGVGAVYCCTTGLATAIVVAALALSILNRRRYLQAQTQLDFWEDPTSKNSNMRKQIGEKGFPYIFNKKLKGTLAHPSEVFNCYIKWTDEFFNKFNKPISQKDIKAFFALNPLDSKTYNYAYFEEDPSQYLKDLGSAFSKIKIQFTDFHNKVEAYRSKINQEEARLNRENSMIYKSSLQPIKNMMAILINNWATSQNAAIDTYESTHIAKFKPYVEGLTEAFLNKKTFNLPLEDGTDNKLCPEISLSTFQPINFQLQLGIPMG